MGIKLSRPKLSLPKTRKKQATAGGLVPAVAIKSSAVTSTPRPPLVKQSDEKGNPPLKKIFIVRLSPDNARRASEMRKILAERFPKCFREPPLPLKIGIFEAVLEAAPELSHRDVLNAIAGYAGEIEYLQVHIEGAARIDLNGKQDGVVTASEQRYAQQRLADPVVGLEVRR